MRNCVMVWRVCSVVRVVFHAVPRRWPGMSSYLFMLGISDSCIVSGIQLAKLTLSTSYITNFYHSQTAAAVISLS